MQFNVMATLNLLGLNWMELVQTFHGRAMPDKAITEVKIMIPYLHDAIFTAQNIYNLIR